MFWKILGIEPTRDVDVIKAAYAAAAKEHNPEDDPEGFGRLHDAYRRALAYAGQGDGYTPLTVAGPVQNPLSGSGEFDFGSLNTADDGDEESEFDPFFGDMHILATPQAAKVKEFLSCEACAKAKEILLDGIGIKPDKADLVDVFEMIIVDDEVADSRLLWRMFFLQTNAYYMRDVDLYRQFQAKVDEYGLAPYCAKAIADVLERINFFPVSNNKFTVEVALFPEFRYVHGCYRDLEEIFSDLTPDSRIRFEELVGFLTANSAKGIYNALMTKMPYNQYDRSLRVRDLIGPLLAEEEIIRNPMFWRFFFNSNLVKPISHAEFFMQELNGRFNHSFKLDSATQNAIVEGFGKKYVRIKDGRLEFKAPLMMKEISRKPFPGLVIPLVLIVCFTGIGFLSAKANHDNNAYGSRSIPSAVSVPTMMTMSLEEIEQSLPGTAWRTLIGQEHEIRVEFKDGKECVLVSDGEQSTLTYNVTDDKIVFSDGSYLLVSRVLIAVTQSCTYCTADGSVQIVLLKEGTQYDSAW